MYQNGERFKRWNASAGAGVAAEQPGKQSVNRVSG
jgi:hypothetical protein